MRDPHSVADTLARRVIPRVIIARSRIDWPARTGASVRRGLGRQGCVELFFAFDDPCSAVAVTDLSERLAGRNARLVLLPVVHRGIPDDPAVGQKRDYALTDARRLGARSGLRLRREEPLDPDSVSFLAEWTASAKEAEALTSFCVDALRLLWFGSDGPVPRHELAALWTKHVGAEPPLANTSQAVRRNEAHMRRRGPYDTPAAWVHGRWFFAHDRPKQVAARLDELGWGSAA